MERVLMVMMGDPKTEVIVRVIVRSGGKIGEIGK